MTTKVKDETLTARNVISALEAACRMAQGGNSKLGVGASVTVKTALEILERWRLQTATQPPPDTGGEWIYCYVGTSGHGNWHVRERGNSDCIAHAETERHAAQIVADHNAVRFALRSGRNWTLTDWQNWLRWHATKERQ